MGSPCSTYLSYYPFTQARQGPDTLSARSKLPHPSPGSWHSALGYSLPVLPAAGALERLCNKNNFFFFCFSRKYHFGVACLFPRTEGLSFPFTHLALCCAHREHCHHTACGRCWQGQYSLCFLCAGNTTDAVSQ